MHRSAERRPLFQVDLSAALPLRACRACASSAALAAPFVRLCHDSDKKWHEITDYLTQIHTDSQTTIVYLDDNMTTVHAKPCKTEKQALRFVKARFKTINRRSKMQCDATCPECDKPFTSIVSLNLHLRDLKKIMCVRCKKIVPLDSYLNHVRTHNSVAYKCKNCCTIYEGEAMYMKHRKMCRYRGKHACPECSKCFPSSFNLVAHVASKHSPKMCASCGKKFSRACFKNHQKYCANAKPVGGVFICDYCSKTYNYKNALKLHIRFTHMTGWEYQCEQCGKKFSNPAHLKEHGNTHNRVEDRYVCCVCGSKYSTRRGYERHYKRHFDADGVLVNTDKRKERRVTTEAGKRQPTKVFVCLVCNFASIHKRVLEDHTKNEHVKEDWDDLE